VISFLSLDEHRVGKADQTRLLSVGTELVGRGLALSRGPHARSYSGRLHLDPILPHLDLGGETCHCFRRAPMLSRSCGSTKKGGHELVTLRSSRLVDVSTSRGSG
jgi:hypothetical protein